MAVFLAMEKIQVLKLLFWSNFFRFRHIQAALNQNPAFESGALASYLLNPGLCDLLFFQHSKQRIGLSVLFRSG